MRHCLPQLIAVLAVAIGSAPATAAMFYNVHSVVQPIVFEVGERRITNIFTECDGEFESLGTALVFSPAPKSPYEKGRLPLLLVGAASNVYELSNRISIDEKQQLPAAVVSFCGTPAPEVEGAFDLPGLVIETLYITSQIASVRGKWMSWSLECPDPYLELSFGLFSNWGSSSSDVGPITYFLGGVEYGGTGIEIEVWNGADEHKPPQPIQFGVNCARAIQGTGEEILDLINAAHSTAAAMIAW